MKKILALGLLNPIPINTGGKSGTFYILNTLGEKFKVDYFYFEEEKIKKGLVPKNINFNIYKFKTKNIPLLPGFLKKLHFETLLIEDWRKFKGYDIVYLDFPYHYHIAKKLSKINNNIPIILGMHNIERKYYKNNKSKLRVIIKKREEFVIKNVTKTIFVSYKDYLFYKEKGFKNIDYINHGVIEEIYNPYDKNTSIKNNNNKFNILFFGKLDSQQNKDALQFIDKKLAKLIDNDIEITIFGNGNLSFQLNDKKINFLGLVDNPANYIKKAKLCIFPLFDDTGVKMRILESLYCGKLILTTPQGAKGLPKELIDLVKICKNEYEFAKYINFYKKNPDKLKSEENKIKDRIIKYIEKSKKTLLDKFDI